MKCLIIAEKPSVAADLARALGKIPKKGDHYENDEYVISSAVGHLVGLQMPEDIDKKKYGFWRLETLPIIPDEFELQPLPEGKDRFGQLKKLLARKDVTSVINACDAGREGELIFTYIYQLTKCKKPFQRLWMSSMTNEGITEAFKHLRSAEQMQGLADAARCRSESDWLIGINGTRALTKRMFGSRAGNVASVGRVQTPTLAIVFNRELEIRNFKPRDYWRITARFEVAKGTYEGVYQRPNFRKAEGDEHDRIDRLWDRAMAEAINAACQGHPPATVTEEKKGSTQAAPRLYDLTTLQREANNRYGLPARRTLQIAQALYERHKMITYPRTDSRALPEEYIPTCRETLQNLHGDLAGHAAKVLDQGWLRPNKRIFNNAQISDHFAIIPTTHEAKHLDEMEAKIFDMIARRFVAAFYPAAEFDVTTRISTVAGHEFRTEGKVLTAPGWLAVYGKATVDDDSPDSKALPALTGEDKNRARTLEAVLHAETTKPPPRYTEATLLSAMEGAGKMVDDEELRAAMAERGLGTPATRAQIIEGLISEQYIHRDGRELIPSAKAFSLITLLKGLGVTALTSPELTGGWEYKLAQMEHGKLSREAFMNEIAEMTREVVERAKRYESDTVPGEFVTLQMPCPKCGGVVKENYKKFACQACDWSTWKIVAGRQFEYDEIETLLRAGKVGPLLGFRNKMGRLFNADIVLNEDKQPTFDFGQPKEGEEAEAVDFSDQQPVGACPKCASRVFEHGMAYVCEKSVGPGKSCDFRSGKVILQQPIEREQMARLLTEGKTELLKGFVSARTRRKFSAFLVRGKDGKVGFEFEAKAPKAGAKPAAGKGDEAAGEDAEPAAPRKRAARKAS